MTGIQVRLVDPEDAGNPEWAGGGPIVFLQADGVSTTLDEPHRVAVIMDIGEVTDLVADLMTHCYSFDPEFMGRVQRRLAERYSGQSPA